MPDAGADAWREPDPTTAPVARLDPRLPVQVLQSWGAWAEVAAANGWTAWIDGRSLVPITGEVAQEPARPASVAAGADVRTLALVGVGLVVLGTFLPWFSFGGASVSAWDVPLRFLVAGTSGSDGIEAAPFLLLVAIATLPAVAPRRFPAWLLLVAGAVATNAAILALGRVLRPEPHPDIGLGALVTLAGGVLLGIEFYRVRRQQRHASPAR